MDEQHACLTCDCCKHLPPVPTGPVAQHSLVKQLNLFMELEALLMSNDLNDNNEDDIDDDDDAQVNNYDDTEEHDSFIKQQMNADNQHKLDDSLVYIDSNISNNNTNKQDFELIDESEEELPSQSMNKMGGELKFNPLLPSYLYEELPGGQSKLLSMGEPLVGRDWTFKEIEKVIFFQ